MLKAILTIIILPIAIIAIACVVADITDCSREVARYIGFVAGIACGCSILSGITKLAEAVT